MAQQETPTNRPDCLNCENIRTRVFRSTEDLEGWCMDKEIDVRLRWSWAIKKAGELRLYWCPQSLEYGKDRKLHPRMIVTKSNPNPFIAGCPVEDSA